EAFSRDFDAAEIGRGCGLRFVIGFSEARGRMVIRAADVEADVAVGADAAKEKSDSAEFAHAVFEFLAPLVNSVQRVLLNAFQRRVRLARAQAQVARAVWEYVVQTLCRGEADLTAVHEQTFFRIEAEAFDVIFADVMVEAVLALGGHRIKFV